MAEGSSGVVVGPTESVVEGVDGLALEAESDVGVDAGGDADMGVAEEFLDHDEVDALFQEQGGGGVPEVVEADAPEPGPVEEAAKRRVRLAGSRGRPVGVVKTRPLSLQSGPAVPCAP